jgi:hypothetical protein
MAPYPCFCVRAIKKGETKRFSKEYFTFYVARLQTLAPPLLLHHCANLIILFDIRLRRLRRSDYSAKIQAGRAPISVTIDQNIPSFRVCPHLIGQSSIFTVWQI